MTESRHQSYNEEGHLTFNTVPDRIPTKHTMGPEAFRKYIGRIDNENLKLDDKKFSTEQGLMIAEAYEKGCMIRVIGAYRHDFEFLAKQNNTVIDGRLVYHDKQKMFNNRRQVMGWVRSDAGSDRRELWILVFPSKQYVDQTAELVKAIISDFKQTRSPMVHGANVTVSHFPSLENTVTTWTGFDDFISLFIKHGDVVVIGNIDFLIEGIRDFSFPGDDSNFVFGGLDDMFGIMLSINRQSSIRILLVGVRESYWGEASAKYVEALLTAGANHILYGSKAATIVKGEDVHLVYAPSQFALCSDETNCTILPFKREDFGDFIENLGISTTGLAITVPTVVGETFEQYQAFEKKGPTCMDCENGHIAKVIENANADLISQDSRLTSLHFKKFFIPIHFITDYIYSTGETIDHSGGNLSVHANKASAYRRKREIAFRKIGNVFAAYALNFGVRNAVAHITGVNSKGHGADGGFEEEYAYVQPLLDAGLGKEALAAISARKEGSEYGIVPAILYAITCQKDGYISAANSALDRLRSPDIQKLLSEEEKTRIEVIWLKICSQVGAKSRIINAINLLKSTEQEQHLKRINQFGSVRRREAVLRARLGDFDAAKNAITLARDTDSENDMHYENTNNLFSILTSLPLSHNRKQLEEISQKLSEIRSSYLSTNASGKFLQTNFEKCAIAALFLESGFYLQSGTYNLIEKGARILTVAHLYNSRLGENETSETYGELISSLTDNRIRNTMIFAMRKDTIAQNIFLRWANSRFSFLPTVAGEFRSIFRLAVKDREDATLKLIS